MRDHARIGVAYTAFQLTVVQFSRAETHFLCQVFRVPKNRSNLSANVPMKGEYSIIEGASTAVGSVTSACAIPIP